MIREDTESPLKSRRRLSEVLTVRPMYWTGRQRTRPVPFDAEDIFRSAVLPGFWLRKSWLLKQETDAFTAFTEIIGQQVPDDLRAKWKQKHIHQSLPSASGSERRTNS